VTVSVEKVGDGSFFLCCTTSRPSDVLRTMRWRNGLFSEHELEGEWVELAKQGDMAVLFDRGDARRTRFQLLRGDGLPPLYARVQVIKPIF